MKSKSAAEARSILKGIAQEILLDPETQTGGVCLGAVPLKLVGGNMDDTHEMRTPPGDDALSCAIKRVAGGRTTARETTDQLESWRRSFEIGSVRMAA